jgi:hypothetical protein
LAWKSFSARVVASSGLAGAGVEPRRAKAATASASFALGAWK